MKSPDILPLPTSTTAKPKPAARRPSRVALSRKLGFYLTLLILGVVFQGYRGTVSISISRISPPNAADILDKCNLLNTKPGPPPDFHPRDQNDGFVTGTKPTLIKNATIWTGSDNGFEVLQGDILLDRGLVKQIGQIDLCSFAHGSVDHIEAQGKWVSPGIIDLHSHL